MGWGGNSLPFLHLCCGELMSKSVVFSQCGRIACAGNSSPAVILCLSDADLLADNDCGRTTIAGVLTNVYKDTSCNTTQYWRYVVSYDETLLANPLVALTSSQVTGIFCKSCLTTWVEDEIACATGTPLTVEDTDTIDLTLVDNVLSADYIGAAGGGCVVEVTTAELNATIAGSTLTPGCTYAITDFVQGRIVAGAIVYVQALTVNTITSTCSVLTTYDTELWRGVYDVNTNKLTELSDNLGNFAKQTANLQFGPYTCIDDFDWGNPVIVNCSIDNSIWTIDYGVVAAAGIENVHISGNSELDMTNWSGIFIQTLTIDKSSLVDLADSNTDIEEVIVVNSSGIVIRSTLNSFLFNTTVDGSYITVNEPTGLLTLENVGLIGFSGVYHAGVGEVYVFGCELNAFGEVRIVPSTTIATEVFIESSTISGIPTSTSPFSADCIFISGANTEDIYLASCSTSSGGCFMINDVSVNSLEIKSCQVSCDARLVTTAGGSLEAVSVNQGTLNTDGFDLTNVYVLGNTTTTCTANNTNTGRDYFNNSIV